LAFDLTIAPRLRQTGANGGKVPLKCGGKVVQLDDAAPVACVKPRVQAVWPSPTHHLLKAPEEISGNTNVLVLEEVRKQRGFDRVALVLRAEQHPDQRAWSGERDSAGCRAGTRIRCQLGLARQRVCAGSRPGGSSPRLAGPAGHLDACPGVSVRAQFPPELARIVTTVVPALGEIGDVGVDPTDLGSLGVALRIGFRVGKVAGGRPAEVPRPRNLTNRDALGEQDPRRLPAGEAAPAPRIAGGLFGRGRETERTGRRPAPRREELGGCDVDTERRTARRMVSLLIAIRRRRPRRDPARPPRAKPSSARLWVRRSVR
jgi:hypothetical protein